MFRFLLLAELTLCLAPVPKHLMPAPPGDPVQPGFTWWYLEDGVWHHLQVVRRDDDLVYFRSLNTTKGWAMSGGWNVQHVGMVRAEANRPQLPDDGRWRNYVVK